MLKINFYKTYVYLKNKENFRIFTFELDFQMISFIYGKKNKINKFNKYKYYNEFNI